jgi:DNA repair photolyase
MFLKTKSSKMSLMPEKMRAILENGTSPIIKRVQFLEKLFQAGYSTHINFSPIIYHDKKLSGYKELFNIINNEVSEEFKNKPVSNVFSLLTMLIFTK